MNELTTNHGGIAQASTDLLIIAAYIESLDASNKTRETYTRALRQWRSFLTLTGCTIMTATRQTVLDYKQQLKEQGKSAATINAYLSAVRGLYATLEAEGIKPNIAASVKGIKRAQNTPKEALTIEQARRILTPPTDGATLEELRNFAIVTLLTRRGLRTVEAARANICDIRQVGGQAVLYLRGKGYGGAQSGFVVLGETCLCPLYAYLKARGETDTTAPLFASIGNRNHGGRMTTRTISRIAKTALEANGINSPTITAHSLRHTAVTLALIGGANLQEVQAMARHSSINTTMIYAHNLRRMEAGAEHALDELVEGYPCKEVKACSR